MDWFRDFLSRKRLVLRSPITEKEMCGFSLACLAGGVQYVPKVQWLSPRTDRNVQLENTQKIRKVNVIQVINRGEGWGTNFFKGGPNTRIIYFKHHVSCIVGGIISKAELPRRQLPRGFQKSFKRTQESILSVVINLSLAVKLNCHICLFAICMWQKIIYTFCQLKTY